MVTKKPSVRKARSRVKARAAQAPDRHSLSGQLRHVITARRLTAYATAKAAGVDVRLVQRFLDGERDIRLATADKIAQALGLRLVEVTPRKATARARPQAAADAGGD
jgi:transcriptional regulator with XRE-family HTH domain